MRIFRSCHLRRNDMAKPCLRDLIFIVRFQYSRIFDNFDRLHEFSHAPFLFKIAALIVCNTCKCCEDILNYFCYYVKKEVKCVRRLLLFHLQWPKRETSLGALCKIKFLWGLYVKKYKLIIPIYYTGTFQIFRWVIPPLP